VVALPETAARALWWRRRPARAHLVEAAASGEGVGDVKGDGDGVRRGRS
jgi:hypothetical protein